MLGDVDRLPQRIGGRMIAAALGLASTTLACAEAVRELRFRDELLQVARDVLGEATNASCVLATSVGFAALKDDPSAVHVRLRAPLEWRIATYQRESVVDRQTAEKAVKHADHQRHLLAKAMYRADADDESNFSLVLDVSRFPVDRMVEILLAAGARRPAAEIMAERAASW